MISKQAISYDLREARELLASGLPDEARKHIGRIIENLEFLLSPSGGRMKTGASAADQFGRANVEALRVLCEQATAKVVLGDNDGALAVLHAAQRFCDTRLTAPKGS